MNTLMRLCLAGCLLALIPFAHADTYPERAVKVVVPFAPAGNVDVVARLMNQKLEIELGRPFVTENMAGASGAIGSSAVARSKPDGYTLLANSSIHVILPSLQSNLGYDAVKDFIPLSQITEVPLVLLVSMQVPATTHQEFIAWARAQSDAVNYATFTGSAGHLAGELWKEQTGVRVTAIPYKVGTMMIADVMGGRIPFMFDALFSAANSLKSGKLRALAITGTERSSMLPDVPTFGELGFPGIDTSTWHGYWAPKGTPAHVVQRLSAALVKVAQTQEVRDRVHTLGGRVIASSPDGFAEFIQKEQSRWAALLKRSGIEPQ